MSERFCYVSSKPGAIGAHAACSDADDYKDGAAEFCAREVRAGNIVQRVTSEDARELLGKYLEWKQGQETRSLFPIDTTVTKA